MKIRGTSEMKSLTAIFLLTISLLAGCGGDSGSSSSGGSGATGGGTPVDLSTLVGSYAGSSTIRLSALGISETDTSSVRVMIAAGGGITIRFDDSVVATGSLAADGSFLIRDSVANAGLDECTGSISITGRATRPSVTATINSSNVSCSGIPATATGSLNAARQ